MRTSPFSLRLGVYLGANILIDAVEDAAGVGRRLRPAFDRIDFGELRGVTSELTPAEVLVKPTRDGAAAVRREDEQLLDPADPLTVPPTSRAVLKPPDAIHAATAMLNGCTTFLTNDARFETIPGLPVLLLSKLPSHRGHSRRPAGGGAGSGRREIGIPGSAACNPPHACGTIHDSTFLPSNAVGCGAGWRPAIAPRVGGASQQCYHSSAMKCN